MKIKTMSFLHKIGWAGKTCSLCIGRDWMERWKWERCCSGFFFLCI